MSLSFCDSNSNIRWEEVYAVDVTVDYRETQRILDMKRWCETHLGPRREQCPGLHMSGGWVHSPPDDGWAVIQYTTRRSIFYFFDETTRTAFELAWT